MDNEPDTILDIHFYNSLDDLPMRNWLNANIKNDLSWIIYGFEGYPKQKCLPLSVKDIWDAIKDDYEEKTRDVNALDYYELIIDKSDLEMRLKIGSVLCSRVVKRPFMPADLLNEYVDELSRHRFFINKEKPLGEEMSRIQNQLESIRMKIVKMTNQIEAIESGLSQKGIPVLKLKSRIQRIIKTPLDFKSMTVTEWIYLLEDVSLGKVA